MYTYIWKIESNIHLLQGGQSSPKGTPTPKFISLHMKDHLPPKKKKRKKKQKCLKDLQFLPQSLGRSFS